MGYKTTAFLLFILFFVCQAFSQPVARVQGTITGEDNQPLSPVSVSVEGRRLGTITNEKGYYELELPAGEDLRLVISFLGYEAEKSWINLTAGSLTRVDKKLKADVKRIDEVSISGRSDRSTNLTRINMKDFKTIPNTSGGIEAMIKALPGVSSRNELSSQYSVRGGNFDENLVYVNDIEIYRPLLIRSGQQEGLSFINPDLVSQVRFSAGGFEARYGDKMASVLDVTYKKPTTFGGSASMSFLGGTAHIEGISHDKKFTYVSGFRYKTSKYLLNSTQTKGEYSPSFLDFQTLLNWEITPRSEISFLANIAGNRYDFVPETRSTSFGTWQNPLNLVIYYDGQEEDKFNTYMGALTYLYKPVDEVTLKLIASGYRSTEQETFDILGQYLLNELDNTPGSDTYGDSILNIGVGTMLNHARNYLTSEVFSLSHIGTFQAGNHRGRWSVAWQTERINDRVREWNMIDSADFSIPNSDSQVLMDYFVASRQNIQSNRVTGYIQDTYQVDVDNSEIFITGGVRANYWDFNNELVISPRGTLSWIPGWEKDMMFQLSAGYYYQPPFYKELRNYKGEVNPTLKAQKSVHFVLGGDYNMRIWDRPFKFSTEMYYKHLDRLIPYKLDNVRVRYSALNSAKGYAAGIDFKINGEFVPGTESWASMSFMRTMEDDANDIIIDADGNTIYPGYYPRLTDQFFNFSLVFQDYLPNNPLYKMHLSMFYGSGVPMSPPLHGRFDNAFKQEPFPRIKAYRRVDVGFSKLLVGEGAPVPREWLKKVKTAWVSAEIFNVLDIQNTVSHLWVKTVTNQIGIPNEFAVPNFLTSRRLNIKLTVAF